MTLTDINLDHQIDSQTPVRSLFDPQTPVRFLFDPQTPVRSLFDRSIVWSPVESPEAPTGTWETEDGPEGAETEPEGAEDGPEGATLRDRLYQKILSNWVDAAMRHHSAKEIAPGEFVAAVAWIQGAIGYGVSEEDAVDSLRYGLADWLHLKLVDGDDDIPVLGGLNFNPR